MKYNSESKTKKTSLKGILNNKKISNITEQMKKHLTLMFAFMASICYANAQEENNDVCTTNTDRYYLVTSKDDLHDGDKVIIVGETSNDSCPIMAERTDGSNKSVIAYKNEDDSFSPVTNITILTYEKNKKPEYYVFKNESGKYLTGDGKSSKPNRILLKETRIKDCMLIISFSSTDYSATVSFNNTTDREIGYKETYFNNYLKSNKHDKIYLYRKISTPTLSETDESISNVISQYIGTSNVTLERTFYNDSWNTWCMPFNITQKKIQEVFGNNTKVYAYTKVENGTMTFTPLVGNMEASVPYLVWPEKETRNPTFTLVDFRKETEAQTITKDGLSFCGTYAPYQMNEDGTEMFINAKNKLTIPTESSQKMKGLRAFFRIENGTSEAKISFSDTTDGLSSTEKTDRQTDKIYDITGRFAGTAYDKLDKGIYIINGIKTIKE